MELDIDEEHLTLLTNCLGMRPVALPPATRSRAPFVAYTLLPSSSINQLPSSLFLFLSIISLRLPLSPPLFQNKTSGEPASRSPFSKAKEYLREGGGGRETERRKKSERVRERERASERASDLCVFARVPCAARPSAARAHVLPFILFLAPNPN